MSPESLNMVSQTMMQQNTTPTPPNTFMMVLRLLLAFTSGINSGGTKSQGMSSQVLTSFHGFSCFCFGGDVGCGDCRGGGWGDGEDCGDWGGLEGRSTPISMGGCE